jgi:hypothetical protein
MWIRGVKKVDWWGLQVLPHFLTLRVGMHPASTEIFDAQPTIFHLQVNGSGQHGRHGALRCRCRNSDVPYTANKRELSSDDAVSLHLWSLRFG